MKTCLYVVIIHAISTIKCTNITIGAVVQGNETQLVKDLEKQKSEIYNQLNEAVEDTVKVLQKSNHTFAKEGIDNLLDLMLLMDKFNGSELTPVRIECNSSAECASNDTDSKTTNTSNLFEDGRRFPYHYKKSKSSHGYDHIKQAIMQMGFIKNNVDLNKVRDEKLRNLLAFQAKLDKWIKLREIEKRKIKENKAKQAGQRLERLKEVCPDFGDKKNKGKTDKYPCCRKCCKKSYLGCL